MLEHGLGYGLGYRIKYWILKIVMLDMSLMTVSSVGEFF